MLVHAPVPSRAALNAQRRLSWAPHATVVSYLAGIGGVLGELGRYEEAETHLREAHALALEIHGEKHPDVAMTLGHLAALARRTGDLDGARQTQRQAVDLALELWGPKTPEAADYLSHLGKLQVALGAWTEAKESLSAALATFRAKLAPTAAVRIGCTGTLATVASELGEFAWAAELLTEALAGIDEAHGPDSEDGKAIVAALARLHQMQGDYRRAQPLFERLMKDPPREPLGRAAVQNNYALVLLMLHRPEEAERLFRDARDAFREVVGAAHPAIGVLTSNVAECLRVKGDRAAAEAECERALDLLRRAHGAEHPMIANALTKLGRIRGDRDMMAEALAMRRRVLPEGHPDVARTLVAMGDAASLEEAVAIYREALPGSPQLAEAESDLAALRIDEGRLDEAKALLDGAVPVLERALGGEHPATGRALERLEKTR